MARQEAAKDVEHLLQPRMVSLAEDPAATEENTALVRRFMP